MLENIYYLDFLVLFSSTSMVCCIQFWLHLFYNRFADSIDLNVTDPIAHKHTPYVVILVKMAEEWTKNHSGSLPSTREEKKEFKVYILNQDIFFKFVYSIIL